eukprot:1751093-Pyramimonas_sp.AAC.1
MAPASGRARGDEPGGEHPGGRRTGTDRSRAFPNAHRAFRALWNGRGYGYILQNRQISEIP